MSLRANVAASLAAQGYIAVVGVLVLPLYVRYIGLEAFGLVGIFTLIQAWMNVLDLGLSPTIARETARLRGGAMDALTYRRLARVLQLTFVLLGALVCTAIIALAPWAANHWLNVNDLSIATVVGALQLIAVAAAMRWVSGFYRSCLAGFEKQVWLSGFNVLIATARFPGALALVAWVDASPWSFFSYQVAVSLVELLVLVTKANSLMPCLSAGQTIGWAPRELLKPVASVLGLTAAFSFTSVAWIFVMQIDKIILSKTLPLASYGSFSLAVLVASAILALSAPVSSALLPRLARLYSESKQSELLQLYRRATQFVTAVAVPLSIALALFSHEILQLWTGNEHLAQEAKSVLSLYSLGNLLLVLGAFPYYLQYAAGKLRLHVAGVALFVSVLVPGMLLAARLHGAVGVAVVWLACHLLYLFGWTPVIHRQFLGVNHSSWLIRDIGRIAWPSLVVLASIAGAANVPTNVFGAALMVGVPAAICVALGLLRIDGIRLGRRAI